MTTTVNVLNNLSSFNFNGSPSINGANGVADLGVQSRVSTTYNTGYTCEWVVTVSSGTVDLAVEWSGPVNQTLYWQVDGGAQGSAVGTGAGYSFVTVATGLGVGKHVVRHTLPQYYVRAVQIGGTGTATITTVPCPVALFVDNASNLTVGSVVSPVARWGTQHVQSSTYVNNNHPGFQFAVNGNYQGVDVLAFVTNGIAGLAYAVDQATVPAPISAYTMVKTFPTGDIAGISQMIPVAAGLSAGTHTVELLDLAQNGYYAVRTWNGSALSSAASAAATTISVLDVTNIAAGDWLCLDYLQNEEVVKVSSISGSGPYTLTLSSALAKAHASGTSARNFTPANAPTIVANTVPKFSGRLVNLGDSISHAESLKPDNTIDTTIYNGYDPRASWAFMAAREMNYEYVGGATQGITSTTVASSNDPTYSDAGKPATVYAVLIGTNDFGSGNTPLATYQTNIETIIGQCKTAAPAGATILISKVFSVTNVATNGVTGASKADFNARQAAAVAGAQAPKYVIEQIDVSTGMSMSGPDIPDNTHPSIAGFTTAGTGGQNKMGAVFKPYLAAPRLSCGFAA